MMALIKQHVKVEAYTHFWGFAIGYESTEGVLVHFIKWTIIFS